MSKAQLLKQIASIQALPKTPDVKTARIRAAQLEAIQDELAITPDDPKPDHTFVLSRLDEQLAGLPTADVDDQESLRLRFVIQKDILALGGTLVDPVITKTVNGKSVHYSIQETVALPPAVPAPVPLVQNAAKAKAIATLQSQVDALKASMT